jgi:CTP synthase (UTP-ammonia lyase)
LKSGPLKIAGVDDGRNVRIVELSDHRFFIATLFMPQFSSSPDRPHPLILAFVKAAAEIHTSH